MARVTVRILETPDELEEAAERLILRPNRNAVLILAAKWRLRRYIGGGFGWKFAIRYDGDGRRRLIAWYYDEYRDLGGMWP